MTQRIARRDFLRTAAAAGLAVPYFVPGAALGKDGATAPGERIGLGFIGLGNRGNGILGGFLRPDTVALAACDVWSNRREAVAQRLGNQCKPYNDFREVIARPDIDAVVIATPEHWHVLPALAAVRAKKDVFCEKPISLTLDQGRALSDACRQHGRLFQHGTQQRGEYGFRYVCELVRNGRIGKLQSIKVSAPGGLGGGSTKEVPVPKELDYDLWLGPAAKIPYVGQAANLDVWDHRSDYSAGYISAWGIHYIDIAQWGSGNELAGPVEYEGRAVFAKGGFNDDAISWNVDCTYPDGVTMSYCSDGGPHKHGVRFEGTKGWVYVKRGGYSSGPESLVKEKIGPDEVHLYSANIYANFLECIRTRKETVCPIEVAHRAVSVCHLANIACLTGRKLKWDLKQERFIGDAEADKLLSRPMRAPWRLG